MLIRELFQKMQNEFELRRSLFLNVVFRNIDILTNNARSWFGNDVPEEYSAVINSLIHLSVTYFEEADDYINSLSETQYVKFGAVRAIEDIIRSFSTMVGFQAMTHEGTDADEVRTSPSVFRESVLNVLLALCPYIGPQTRCHISHANKMNNHVIGISFSGLDAALPDPGKLQKLFYTIPDAKGMKIRMGLANALDSIRRIGGSTRIQADEETAISLEISFVRASFLDEVDAIRQRAASVPEPETSAVVLIFTGDRYLDIMLKDSLADFGITAWLVKPDTFFVAPQWPDATALITSREIVDVLREAGRNAMLADKRTFVVMKSGEAIPDCADCIAVGYPIDIEWLAGQIGKP